jgi:plasmid stabilization system protein ParE
MILYTVRARNDLYEIENYLELLNPAASRRVLAAIKSKINRSLPRCCVLRNIGG